MGAAVKMLLVLLTTLSCAPLVDTPERPPVTVMPVVEVRVAVATDPTLTELLVVNAACFVERVVLKSTPARYNGTGSAALFPDDSFLCNRDFEICSLVV